MGDRPILFSAPMVRALLDGRKTQTRRIIKDDVRDPPGMDAINPRNRPKHPAPYLDAYCSERRSHLNPRGMSDRWCWWTRDDRQCLPTFRVPCMPGDRLWVRETWQTGVGGDGPQIAFRATGDCHDIDAWDGEDEGAGPSFNYERCPGAKWHTWLPDLLSGTEGAWRPSLFMPRWVSRLTLVVTDVRVERLQDITEADAQAEGADGMPMWGCHRNGFNAIWIDINGIESWNASPWVAAISFTVHQANIDAKTADALDIAGAA